MQKILLITCYFGKFPWYFDLFLKSCTYNPTVDFIIFSDSTIPDNLSDNVKIIPFTLKKFNMLATEKLGFKINVKSAYKLCDFKPAYGLIFLEYIKGYPFWGITDIDIVFGRIREFMTDDLLNNNDVISVRNDYPTGSFMLFKNNDKVNGLFMKSKDYKTIFTSEIHYCFDECNFKHNFLQEGGNIFDIDCEIESMLHVIKKEQAKNALKAHFDFFIIEGLPGLLKWEKGFLSFKNEFEVLLHHLILYKGNRFTRKKTWKQTPDIFFIDKYMIRKSELNSFKGYIENILYNKLIPDFKKLVFKLDYIISNKLHKKVMDLERGSFKLNDMHIHIIKNTNNENFISLGYLKDEKNLIESIFDNNSFFIPSFPNIKYHLNNEKNVLTELHGNGITQVLKKVNAI